MTAAAPTQVVPVDTGTLETVMTFLGHQETIAPVMFSYLGTVEIYGKEYAIEQATRKAMELVNQGFYVFAHGQSLSFAARTEAIQRLYARRLGDTSGSLWGERSMLMRLPDTGERLPATSKGYLDAFRDLFDGYVADRFAPHDSTLMSVDYMFKNKTEGESAYFFCDHFVDFQAPQELNRFQAGRYYLFAVDPEVIRDPEQNFVYHSAPFGKPCGASLGNEAAALRPDFTTEFTGETFNPRGVAAMETSEYYQARFVMQGYMRALLKGKVRVFVYDSLSYAQRSECRFIFEQRRPFVSVPPPLPSPMPRACGAK